MQQKGQSRKGANQITLTVQSFPLQTERDSFRTYNLYREHPLHGIQGSIILFNPCVRAGCNTTCYFDSHQLNLQLLSAPCLGCGNFNSKVYIDIGLKQLIRQHHDYIANNRPLSVDINAKSKQFFFSSHGIKNDLLGKVSQHIGKTIVEEMAFNQIPIVNKKTLDFSAIDQKLQQAFVPKYLKQSYSLYGFCKYHPQPSQAKDSNYILLFLKESQSPVKVLLFNSNSRPICSSSTYLNDCKIGYLSGQSTFVFEIPKKQGTQYYASSLDFHLDIEQKSMVLIQMPQWREPVGRFNGSLIVDQTNNSFYVVGGYDYQRQQLPAHLVAFQQCRWYLADQHYRFKAERKTHQKQQFYGSKYCSFMLHSVRNIQSQAQSDAEQKFLLSLGGSFKDFSIFARGTGKNDKNNIRYVRLPNSQVSKSVIIQRAPLKLTFPLKNYIVLECPYYTRQRFAQKYRNNALVLGGYKQVARKDLEVVVDQVSKDVYLIDTKHLNEVRVLQQKFEFGHLLSHNLDSYSTLLYDLKKDSYYIRATYPVNIPIKFKNGYYLHYLIVEFDLEEERLRIIPGLLEPI